MSEPDPALTSEPVQPPRPHPLRELIVVFLKIGLTAFGGPPAHIAMMEEECVTRRSWLTRQRFVDFLGAVNLLPGPNSTEMAIYIGYLRARWRGLILGGVAFILPSALIVTALAWAYVKLGRLPQMNYFLYAAKPVIIAVIARALWRYAATAIKNWFLATVALAATGVGLFLPHQLWLLAAAAMVCGGREAVRARPKAIVLFPAASKTLASWVASIAALAGAPASVTLGALFLYFLKVGSVLFGSGYVLIAFLRTDLVDRWHWLTNSQLLDAIAVGQVTPGPLSTTATFIGYVLAGPKGALAATLGMFIPAFVYVAISEPLVRALRRSRIAGAALDGVIAGSVALVAVVTLQLGRAAIADLRTLLIFITSLAILTWTRLNSAWLIVAAGLIGWATWGR
jgi:chromate transporter